MAPWWARNSLPKASWSPSRAMPTRSRSSIVSVLKWTSMRISGISTGMHVRCRPSGSSVGVPQVHHRVSPPGAPALGSFDHLTRRRGETEHVEAFPHADIAHREGVGIMECAHGDVREGPRADASNLAEHAECVIDVGTARDVQFAGRDQLADPADGLAAAPRHPEG